MEKGKLSVHTENILPIIKKWLYSEKEIFLRELLSNAFDAITKARKLSLSEDIYQGDDLEFGIDVTIDRENKLLIIEDNGIGMTGEEIKKYITQIAFSGAEDFIKRYEEFKEADDRGGIIGNFGLGFYSSFMVANKVEVESRSWEPEAKSALWMSSGGEEYELGEGAREKRGTAIKLHMEEEDLLDKAALSELVRKYCDFIPVPIRVDGAQVNKQDPLWSKQPSSLKKEDYTEFYKYLFPFQDEPLFYVHLNVDYPFKLQGLLYFPRLAHEFDLNRSNVKVYCKQIFVSDEAQDLIPKFLTVLQGVIDLPDLPLNVSRSYLQNEPRIKKIAGHIVKKVADRLNEEYKKSREDFEKIWRDIAPFIKFSAMNDNSFYEQIADILLYEIAGGGDKKEYRTLDQYLTDNTARTDGKIYYVSDPVAQAGPLKLLQAEDIQVLLLNTMIDTHFIQFLEMKKPEYKFTRIDSELAETLIHREGESKLVDADDKDLSSRLQELFKSAIGNDKVQIRVEALKTADIPAMVLLPEQARRFSEMSAYMGQTAPTFPDEHTLLLNTRNQVIQNLGRPALVTPEGGGSGKTEIIARQIYSLARLVQGGLGPEEVEKFVSDSFGLLEKVS